MSWTILYKPDFIKIDEDKYIPLVIAGPNNCYEPRYRSQKGAERRTRNSCLWFGTDYEDIILSKKQIMDNIIKEIDECIMRYEGEKQLENSIPYSMNYIKKHLGYFFGMWIAPKKAELTNVSYKHFFLKGFETAKTLKQNPIIISFIEGELVNTITINTPEQLMKQLEDAQKKGWYIGSITSNKGISEIYG